MYQSSSSQTLMCVDSPGDFIKMQSRIPEVWGVPQVMQMLQLEDHMLRVLFTSWARDPEEQWLQQQRAALLWLLCHWAVLLKGVGGWYPRLLPSLQHLLHLHGPGYPCPTASQWEERQWHGEGMTPMSHQFCSPSIRQNLIMSSWEAATYSLYSECRVPIGNVRVLLLEKKGKLDIGWQTAVFAVRRDQLNKL